MDDAENSMPLNSFQVLPNFKKDENDDNDECH